jgi:phenylalanyl-tRNA synthetase beta chain
MKVSLNWLRELVELPPTVPALVDLLTMAGVEVEGIETTGCSIGNIVVAEIQEFEQHPNADKLSVCKVNDGSGTLRQIVCGAKNFRTGDKVPLALPGAQMAPDFVIKVGKLRGVESQGMMCSAEELGLPATLGARGAEDGLLILPADAKPGTPFGEVFRSDTVLDLEVTPNRPDLLSMWGIATEVATLTGKKVVNTPWEQIEIAPEKPLSVSIETVSPCFYSASLVRGAKVAPSPDWLRDKLEAVGLRAINNAVDVTNYVLLYAGQPCHVFDSAKVKGTIRVRDARPDETIVALDGKTYTLTPDDLVIADDEKALAIAGVMGGLDSAVGEATTDIILEIANFEPRRIRRTSRRLGLSSDSSYRFERGVDIGSSVILMEMTSRMLGKLTSATSVTDKSEACTTPAVKEFMERRSPAIPLRSERITALLGIEVSEDRVEQILTGFGLQKIEGGWQAPTRRPDLTREVDLIEEIARVVGMDAIPAKVQARFASASGTDRNYDRAMTLRRAFAAQGLHEARSITLVPSQPLGLAYTHGTAESCLRVKNPMLEEQVVLRPALVHGLLTAVRENFRAGAKSVRLFEVGRVFSTQRPEEFLHAAVVLAGSLGERSWRAGEGRDADLFDLKAILSASLGEGISFEKDANPSLALALVVKMNGKPCGFAGQLWPADARALDASVPVVFAELDLAAMWKASSPDAAKKYREIPRFPATTRDIAMLAPLSLDHAAIAETLAKANEPLLAGVELFDVFTDATGAKIPADQKSVAYSLTYRSSERTLTADEVNAAHNKLKERLKTLGVNLRE